MNDDKNSDGTSDEDDISESIAYQPCSKLPYDRYDFVCRATTVGASAVGKTTLIHRFVHRGYAENLGATIGVEWAANSITLLGKLILLNVYDTCGQERYANMTRTYIKGSHVVYLIFDLTNFASFKRLAEYRALVDEHAPSAVCALIGTKCDRTRHIGFLAVDLILAAKQLRCDGGYFTVSAKLGTNVDRAILTSVTRVIKMVGVGASGYNDAPIPTVDLKSNSLNERCCNI